MSSRLAWAALLLAAAWLGRICVAQQCTPDVLSLYGGGWPTELDFGIYWFGYNDQFEKAKPGEKSLFYGASKPTMLYFHGWAGENGGAVSRCERLTTRCLAKMCPVKEDVLLVKSWLDAGWNVGIFYWDQFADEDCQRDAEQKIWFNKDGKGLTWKSYDVGARTQKWMRYGGAQLSLAEIAAEAVRQAMPEYTGGHVRFVGHDIGAQLAAHSASLLHVEGHPAAPSRLALLEPFFTRYHLKFLRCKEVTTAADRGIGDFAESATTEAVDILFKRYGVVTEVYKSSALTQRDAFGLTSAELSKLATLVIFNPTWCGGSGGAAELPVEAQSVLEEMGKGPNLACYHTAIIPLYFLHFGLPTSPLSNAIPPQVRRSAANGSALRGCATPFAGCTDAELRGWIDRQHTSPVSGDQVWRQRSGMSTFAIEDDIFMLSPDLQLAPEFALRDASELPVPTPPAPAEEESLVASLTKVALLARSLWLPCLAALLVACFLGASLLVFGSRKAGGLVAGRAGDEGDAFDARRSKGDMARSHSFGSASNATDDVEAVLLARGR